MNFRSPSEFRLAKQLKTFATALIILAGMILLFVSASSSQQLPRPPAWSVESAGPAHSSLTLKGSVILGIDSGMFWVVQFRIDGSGANQLGSFQPNMAVTLESSGPKLQAPAALGAKTGGKALPQNTLGAKSPATAVFTGIPTVGQTLVIQAPGVPPIEGVTVSVTGPQSYVIGQPTGPAPPCCAVTVFNSQTGIATAKVSANGQIFVFQAPMHEGPPPGPGQSPQYQQLNVGQPVWANLTTGQVSLDGRTVCCHITAEGISSGPGGKPPAVGVKKQIATTPACCTVTAVSYQTAFQAVIASAKVNSSGQTFEFELPPPPPPPPPCDPLPDGSGCPSSASTPPVSVKVGQSVWANLTTGQVSLDGGATWCCRITAEGVSSSSSTGKPTPLGAKNPILTNQACCEITALNQQAKTANAKVKSNGQAFQIAVSNPTLFQSLRVGQAIWANFKTRQVSLNGAGPVNGMEIMGIGGPLIANVPGVVVKKPPYTVIPSPLSQPLTIHDHTVIMQALFQNQAYVVQEISRYGLQQATPKRVAVEAMLYLLRSNAVPEATKERIRVALQTIRQARWNTPSAADTAFRTDVAIALRPVRDPSSALQALNGLQQKYGGQSRYLTALNLAKNLVNDGASTIYSRTWLARNAQVSTPGGGITPYADVLDPCNSNVDYCEGGDPPLTPTCPDPTQTYPNCSTCPDPTQAWPNCGPPPTGTCPDGSNPPCTQPPPTGTCPDGSNPPCAQPPPTGTCPDGSNPPCTQPPPTGTCPDGSNPPCTQPPPPTCPNPFNPACPGSDCVGYIIVNCYPGANSDAHHELGADVWGCAIGALAGAEATPIGGCIILAAITSGAVGSGGKPPNAPNLLSAPATATSAGPTSASWLKRRPDLQPVLSQVDRATGVVTAKTAKGNFFGFRVTESQQLNQLQPGMPVHVQLSTLRAFVDVGGQRYTFRVISFWPGKDGRGTTEPSPPNPTGPDSPTGQGQCQSHCLEEAANAITEQFGEQGRQQEEQVITGQTGSAGNYPSDNPGLEDALTTCMRKCGSSSLNLPGGDYFWASTDACPKPFDRRSNFAVGRSSGNK